MKTYQHIKHIDRLLNIQCRPTNSNESSLQQPATYQMAAKDGFYVMKEICCKNLNINILWNIVWLVYGNWL